jgi:RNA polymerase sigma factor (sigma-70 family)
MASIQLSTVVRHLHRLAGTAQAGDVTDAELLERFAARRDEAAFAALVRRHGPMVLAACRRILGNHADAEDAFQATFLVLVRKAGSIKRRAALAGWLHEVALRVALQTRASAQRRRRHEQRVPDMPRKDFLTTVVWRDLRPVLDEEVQKLPDACREAFVLCYLEDKTYEQASQQLACSTGTISRRLERARELLRERLTRRGLVLPAGLLAVVLSRQTAPAAVPAALLASTLKAVLQSAAGAAAGVISARVAALAEGGFQAMTTSKTKVALALLLTAGLVVAGAAALARSAPAAAADPGQAGGATPRAAAPPGRTAPPAKEAGDAAKPTVVSGQVVGADGKPVAGARVVVLGRPRARGAGHYTGPMKALAEGKADRDGKFRLAVPGLTRHAYWGLVALLGQAPGHGPGHHPLPLDQLGAPVKLELPRERVLRGRLLDLQGQPVAGAKVGLERASGKLPSGKFFYLDYHITPMAAEYRPQPAVSDAKGYYRLRGLPADCDLALDVQGEGAAVAPQTVEVSQRVAPDREFSVSLAPQRVLEGTVIYQDTGKPVPNARLRIDAVKPYPGGGFQIRSVTARADAGGRYRAVPYEGDSYFVVASPPAGAPYLLAGRQAEKAPGVLKQEINLALRRGILVQGSVKEAPSGKPVAGAGVAFQPRQGNNPFYTRDARFADGVTDADGKFALVVLPGPGHLLINGPTADYLHTSIPARDLSGVGRALSQRYYPDGLVALDLKPDVVTHRVEATLRRGVTLKGRVLGPDGRAVARGQLFCRTYVATGYTLNPVWSLPFRDGRFELPGWDPADPAPVYFLSPELGLGGVLRPGRGDAGKEPTVRLQKCGGARARFVDKQGKPLANQRVVVDVPLTPGLSVFDRGGPFKLKGVAADVAHLANFDPENFNNLRTDAEGRVTLRNLIPGARHWIVVSRPGGGMIRVPLDLIPEAGKTLELKDISVNLN